VKRLLLATRPAAVILVTAMLCASAQGKSENGRQVTVYFHDQANTTGDLMKTQARRQASDMFASIGVTLHWRIGSPARPESGVIAIEFVTDTPDTLLPGGLAYALPYEGVHIRVFWDRIKAAGPYPRQLLAHVMVHEITHILQGTNGHSEEGIMKAHWNERDKSDMQARPLHFSQPDVLLIYRGMDARAAQASKPTAGAMTAGGVKFAAQ